MAERQASGNMTLAPIVCGPATSNLQASRFPTLMSPKTLSTPLQSPLPPAEACMLSLPPQSLMQASTFSPQPSLFPEACSTTSGTTSLQALKDLQALCLYFLSIW